MVVDHTDFGSGEADAYDVIVIGAGWYGLASAATYLKTHPSAKLRVIEAQSTIGGVWSEEREYPDLKSNNMLGTYEYIDFPMDSEIYGVKPGHHIPGAVIRRYLGDYAKKTGVYGRILFGTNVLEASRTELGWELQTNQAGTISTKNLIVATGLTSQPFIPDIPGSDLFTKSNLLFHTREFGQHIERIFDDTKTVTVLGGSKSAWDVAYACAIRDVKVHLIVRESGQGPTWMAPPYVTPFHAWLEKLTQKRFLTWLSPSIWGDEDGYGAMRRFLHGTWLGRKVVDAFWYILSTDANDLMGYDKHEETSKLKPRESAFWTASGLGILNYDTDFLKLVREGKIQVHIADVTRLDERTMYLSSGTNIQTDAVVCATGWRAKPPLSFIPAGIDPDLGLPFNLPSTSPKQLDIAKADHEILSQFPRLKNQPKTKFPGGDLSSDDVNQPFKLYRFIAPPTSILKHHNIAFTGMISTITNPVCAGVQALWISAYLDGKLSRLPDSNKNAENKALLHSRFLRWRYPCGYGARFPDFVFDTLPYMDMLLKDLGLRGDRKGGWFKEIFGSYGVEDYSGVVEEWMEKQGV